MEIFEDNYTYSDIISFFNQETDIDYPIFISETDTDYTIFTSETDIDHRSEVEMPVFFHEIRLSIFYIGALCGGVPCLIWAFYSVHLQRKTRGRISAFIIILLLSDLLQLLLYPYMVSKLFSPFFLYETPIIVIVCFCLKICSLHLQQLVALEGVLALKHPQISAYIFSWHCYIIISLIILLIPGMCLLLLFYSVRGSEYLAFGSFMTPVCLLVVTGIITYKAPPPPASTTLTDKTPSATVFLVSTVTLVVLYLPCVFLPFVLFFDMTSWLVMIFCLVSLTVISEPLLCVLVCTENLSTQKTQTHIELNSEQTSV